MPLGFPKLDYEIKRTAEHRFRTPITSEELNRQENEQATYRALVYDNEVGGISFIVSSISFFLILPEHLVVCSCGL
jgi:hypothetical protein